MKFLALALLLLLPLTGWTDIHKLVRVYAIGLPKKGVLLQEDEYVFDKMGCLHFATGEAELYFSKGKMDERIYYTVCGSFTIITEPQ